LLDTAERYPYDTPIFFKGGFDVHVFHRYVTRKSIHRHHRRETKPRSKRYEVGDPGSRGLRLVVFPSGAKSFILRYRYGGKPRKLTLGPVTLAAARKLAGDAQYALAQNEDPASAKLALKQEQKRTALTQKDTFFSVSETFLKLRGPKLRSLDRRRRELERLIYPEIGARPIADIKRSEIVRLLDKIEESSGRSMAQVVYTIISGTLAWHEGRSDDFRSPCVKQMRRVNAKEIVRKRILTDDELRKVWNACDIFEGAEGMLRAVFIVNRVSENGGVGVALRRTIQRRRLVVACGTAQNQNRSSSPVVEGGARNHRQDPTHFRRIRL
jgi:hypothetical protein